MTTYFTPKTKILRSFFIYLVLHIAAPCPILNAQTIPVEMHPKINLILDTIIDYYHEAIYNEVILQNFYDLNRKSYTEIPEVGFKANNADLDLHRTLESLGGNMYKEWEPTAVSRFLKEKRTLLMRQIIDMAANNELALTDQIAVVLINQKVERFIRAEVTTIQERQGSNPLNWTLVQRQIFFKNFDTLMILHWYKHFNSTIAADHMSKVGKLLSIATVFTFLGFHGLDVGTIIGGMAAGGFYHTSSHFIPPMIYRLFEWRRLRKFKKAFVNHHYPETITSNQTQNESVLSKLGQEVLEPKGNKLQLPLQQKSKNCRTAFSLGKFMRNGR